MYETEFTDYAPVGEMKVNISHTVAKGKYDKIVEMCRHTTFKDGVAALLVFEDRDFSGYHSEENWVRIGHTLYSWEWLYRCAADHLERNIITQKGRTYKNKIDDSLCMFICTPEQEDHPVLISFDNEIWYCIAPIIQDIKTKEKIPDFLEDN